MRAHRPHQLPAQLPARLPDGSPPEPTRSLLMALLGAKILFICIFLPTVVGADGQFIRPIEVATATWPHIMGMFAATGAILQLLGDRTGPRITAATLNVMTVSIGALCSYFLAGSAPHFAAAMAFIAIGALIGIARQPWSFGRALWISGLLIAVALGWVATIAEPLRNLGLSGAGALLLIGGGVGIANAERRARSTATLPRAAIVRAPRG